MAQPSKERTRPSSSGSGIDSMSKTDLPETKPAYNATQHFAHVREHLVLFLFCSAVFVLIAGAGVAIAIVFAEAEETRVRDDALQIAVETGGFFSDQFDRAILPLFSLAQFATELDAFKNLPDQIGQAGEPGSLPFLLPEDENETVFRRNITGVCDEPFLVDKFNQIAATLKRNAAMEGVLVNLQFAPHAVVCLLYPLNNTEDFEDGVFMDNSGAQGVDLLADPLSRFIAEQAIQADRVIVAGPRSLRQCKDCHPTVEQAFIARLPVLSSNHEILVDGVGIPRWGFATALINWEALVTHSGIYDSFEANNMEFVLTRTDRDFDTATEMFSENVVVLAQTQGFEHSCSRWVSTALQTTNNEWEITICYEHVGISPWKPWVIAATIIISLALSILIYTVVYQKHEHDEMLAVTLAQRAKVEMERNMTAYFAHELRNPLAAIDCALRTIPEDQSEETASLLQGMQLSCNFMSSIMNNLLDVRKMEEGRMLLHMQPLSLAQLVQDVRQILSPSVRPGVDFTTRCRTHGRDWVLGDKHRIQQVLTNVVANAIKYTVQGSIVLSVRWDGTMVRFECADSGPGIPKSEQSKLFQRFVTRGGAPGTGLGLAIAKNIVDLAGGTIRFESDPSVKPGTTSVVKLPLEETENVDLEASETSYKEPVLAIQDSLSILIVDDVKMNRMVFGRRFRKGIAPQASVSEATTGEEAIELCGRKTFDVIIMDQFMEGAGGVMLGTDAVFALRRMRIKSLIVVCSGNELEREAKEAGADFFWRKPIPSNETIIEQWRSTLALR